MSDLLLSGSHMDMFNKARRAKHALARALACALLGCCPATSPSDFVVQGIGQCSLWKPGTLSACSCFPGMFLFTSDCQLGLTSMMCMMDPCPLFHTRPIEWRHSRNAPDSALR